jgi:choline kinase
MKMNVIILAAGFGRRLLPITEETPKCLIELHGKPLLERHLSVFKDFGMKKVFLVVGHKKEKILARFGKEYKGMKITYVENKDYGVSGSGYSLWLSLKDMEGEILFMDSDLAYQRKIFKDILSNGGANSLLVGTDRNVDAEGVKVLAKGKYIKEIGKKVSSGFSCVGEAVGVVRLSDAGRRTVSKRMQRRIKDTGIKFEWEDILNESIADMSLRYVSTGKNKWVEIDFISDLKIAEKILRGQQGDQ